MHRFLRAAGQPPCSETCARFATGLRTRWQTTDIGLTEAASLLQEVSEGPWDVGSRATLTTFLQEKALMPAAPVPAQTAHGGSRGTQDYTKIAALLPRAWFDRMQDGAMPTQKRWDMLFEACVGLGLQHPSEKTWAVLVALESVCRAASMPELPTASELFEKLVWAKDQFKTYRVRCQPPDQAMDVLPSPQEPPGAISIFIRV